jgi:hypothetical protein
LLAAQLLYLLEEMSALDEEAEFDDSYKCGTVQVQRKRSLSVQFGDREFDGALDAVLDKNVDCLYDDACIVAAYATDDSPARRKHGPRVKKPVKKSSAAEQRFSKSSRVVKTAPARKQDLIQRGPLLRPVAVAAAAAAKAEAPPEQQLTSIHRMLHRVCKAAAACTAQTQLDVPEEDTELFQVLTALCAHKDSHQRLRAAFKSVKK